MESLMFAAGLTSFALAAAMTLFAWNVIRQNGRREAARTSLLSRLAFPGGLSAAAVTDAAADESRVFRIDELRSEPSLAAATLFSEPQRSGAASRRTIALAAVCVALTLVVGTYRWFAGAATSATAQSEPVAAATMVSVTPPAQVPADPRVELLSLNHRATPAAFLVTGRVRNPVGGAPLHDVVAVVHVMDGVGRMLMTVRAPIKRPVLNAGEWSEFSAAAANATNVARYRVEFHTRERAVIPHFDLRQQESNSRSE